MADDTPKDTAKPSGKGKGKARSDEMTAGTKASQAEPSLAKRVISSTSGLLRDTVGSSHGHVPGLIASSTALGSKAQSSGLSSSPTGSAETGAIRPGEPTSGATPRQQESAQNESFRTVQSQSSTSEDFEQFVSKASGMFDPSAQLDHSYYQSSQSEENRFKQDHFHRPVSNFRDVSQQHSSPPIEIDDGAEVRNLLSDPAFDSAFNDNIKELSADELWSIDQAKSQAIQLDDGAEVRNLLSNTTIDSVFDDSLKDLTENEPSGITANPPAYSELEREIVTAMKSDLPPPPIHKDVPIDHPLNLRPLSDAEKEALPHQIREYEEALAIRGQSLATLPTEGEREIWLSDWEDVLNGYSDHVWGDILPTVKAAKSELEDVRNGSASLDSKTVARLKMILGHVYEHAGPPTPDSIFAQGVGKQEGT